MNSKLSNTPRLLKAVIAGDLNFVKQCIREGDDIDIFATMENVYGEELVFVNALYLACQKGSFNIVKYLVDNGISTTSKVYCPESGDSFDAENVALTHFHFKIWNYIRCAKKGHGNQTSLNGTLKECLLSV
jgi:ankyrin repeat protein